MRKRLGVILGLLIAVVLLAATAQAGTRGAKVTDVTLAGWSSGPDEDTLLNQVIDQFNKAGHRIPWLEDRRLVLALTPPRRDGPCPSRLILND